MLIVSDTLRDAMIAAATWLSATKPRSSFSTRCVQRARVAYPAINRRASATRRRNRTRALAAAKSGRGD